MTASIFMLTTLHSQLYQTKFFERQPWLNAST